MEQCLRNVEEKFIINSGANLIIPHNVVFLRFITMVYAIQGSYLIRNIPNKIEDIYQVNLNEYGKSYLSLTDFVRQVISLVDCAQRMRINPTLLKFSLSKAIPIEEIIDLIKIKRSGDIFTFTENYLYLFLFQCEQSEIKTALAHLILLPIKDLFLEQELFSYIDEIRTEINSITLKKQEKNQQENHDRLQSVMNSLEKKIIKKPAISSPLALKTG